MRDAIEVIAELLREADELSSSMAGIPAGPTRYSMESEIVTLRRVAKKLATLPASTPASGDVVDIVRIERSDRLDPITAYLADEGGGRGRMTVVCYNEAWTCYWGAMGNRSLREFVAVCDPFYVAGNMLSGRKHSAHDGAYAQRVAAAVISALQESTHAG